MPWKNRNRSWIPIATRWVCDMAWIASFDDNTEEFPDWETAYEAMGAFIKLVEPPTMVTFLSVWEIFRNVDKELHITDGVFSFGIDEKS